MKQDPKVEEAKLKEINRLNQQIAARHRLTGESLKRNNENLFEAFSRSCAWVNMQMLTGSTKGTSAAVMVCERLYWVVKDIVKENRAIMEDAHPEYMECTLDMTTGEVDIEA